MAVMVSMLRAVNVGSANRIGMDALKALYESLNLHDCRTYVQSGNVVFRTEEADLARLNGRIAAGIERLAGFRPEVILRTAAEMRDVVRRNPFAGRPHIEPGRLLVVFLAREPAPEDCDKVRRIDANPEELHLDGRELYIHYTNGLARPKVPWTAVEKMLKTPATGRNWNTVTKLLEITEAMAATAPLRSRLGKVRSEPRQSGSG